MIFKDFGNFRVTAVNHPLNITKQTAKSTMLNHQFQPQSILGPSQFTCDSDKTFLSGTEGRQRN